MLGQKKPPPQSLCEKLQHGIGPQEPGVQEGEDVPKAQVDLIAVLPV